jgi:hypothetical protein
MAAIPNQKNASVSGCGQVPEGGAVLLVTQKAFYDQTIHDYRYYTVTVIEMPYAGKIDYRPCVADTILPQSFTNILGAEKAALRYAKRHPGITYERLSDGGKPAENKCGRLAPGAEIQAAGE